MHPSPIAVIQELYDSFNRRDVAKALSLMSPDIEFAQSEELPWGGRYRGLEGAQQFFGKIGARINSTLDVERFISSGDAVTVVGWTQGTVNANGARYRVPIAHVWRVSEGLAVEARFYVDHPAMLEALRAAPADKPSEVSPPIA